MGIEIRNKNDELTVSNNNFEMFKEELETALRETTEELMYLKDYIQDASVKFNAEVAEKDKQLEALFKEVENLKEIISENNESEGSKKEFDKIKMEYENTIAILNIENAEKEYELNMSRNKLRKVETLENEVVTINAEKIEKDNQLQILNEKLQNLKGRVDRNDELFKSRREYEKIQMQYENTIELLNIENTEKECELNMSTRKLEKLKETFEFEVVKSDTTTKEMENDLKTTKNELVLVKEQLENAVSKYTSLIVKQDSELQAYHNQYIKKRVEMENKEADLTASNSEILELKEKMKLLTVKLNSEISGKDNEIDSMKNELSELRKEIVDRNHELVTSRKEFEKIQTQYENTIELLNIENAQKGYELNMSSVSKYITEIMNQDHKLQVYDNKFTKLNLEMEEKEASLKASNNEILKLKEKIKLITVKLNSQISSKDNEINLLKNELRDQDSNLDVELEQSLIDFRVKEIETSFLQYAISSMGLSKLDYETKLSTTSSCIDQLIKNYSDTIIEVENLKLYITSFEDKKALILRNMIDSYSNEMELDSLTTDLECSKKEIFSLQEKVSGLVNSFSESRSEVGILKADLFVAKKKLKIKKKR